MSYDRESDELRLLREQLALEKQEVTLLQGQEKTLLEIRNELAPKLAFIKISFGGSMPGPVTLTVGQSVPATVQGFDQNGAPFAIDFTANPVTWTIDNPALDSSTPQADQSDLVASLSAGTANLTASCAGLTDTEQVINVAAAPKLSSIKINFGTPQ